MSDSDSDSPPLDSDDEDESGSEYESSDDDEEEEDGSEYEEESPPPKKAKAAAASKPAAKPASKGKPSPKGKAAASPPKKGKAAPAPAPKGKAAAPAPAKDKGKAKAKDAPPTPIQSEAEKVENASSKVLQARAEKMGLVLPGAGLPGLRDAPPYEYELLHASKELASLASSRSIDIVKKPSTQAKKPRYLLMLPGKFAALDGGEIGSIERCVVCTRAAVAQQLSRLSPPSLPPLS